MHMRPQTWMLLSLLLLAIPASAQTDTSDQQAYPPVPSMASNAPKKAATTDENYIIGGQDVLDVSVWKEPEVSRVVPVRPDGKISLPLLNDVQAAGLTPAALAAKITDGLKKYVTNPQVTVIVTTINSQRIYVMGEIMRPGAFPMIPGMTVLQAIASGGGFTQYARTKSVYVLRNENGKQVKYPFNYKEVISGKKSDQDILLKPGDRVIIP
jgi:polysaccharide biosynthesis/export protein